MALSHKARKRWSLFLLLVWLPVYIVIAVGLLARVGDMNKLLQIVVYAFLGIAWALPFKPVFTGIGKDAAAAEGKPADEGGDGAA